MCRSRHRFCARDGRVFFCFTILTLRPAKILSRKNHTGCCCVRPVIEPKPQTKSTARAKHSSCGEAHDSSPLRQPWVCVPKTNQAPAGAKEICSKIVREDFLPPLPGLVPFFRLTHGFTVGYFLSSLRDFSRRLLLREAMQRTGTEHEINGMNAYHWPVFE